MALLVSHRRLDELTKPSWPQLPLNTHHRSQGDHSKSFRLLVVSLCSLEPRDPTNPPGPVRTTSLTIGQCPRIPQSRLQPAVLPSRSPSAGRFSSSCQPAFRGGRKNPQQAGVDNTENLGLSANPPRQDIPSRAGRGPPAIPSHVGSPPPPLPSSVELQGQTEVSLCHPSRSGPTVGGSTEREKAFFQKPRNEHSFCPFLTPASRR